MSIQRDDLIKLKWLAEEADSVSSAYWDAWIVGEPGDENWTVWDCAESSCGMICETQRGEAIAEFIAAANPTTVLALIAEAKELQSYKKAWEKCVEAEAKLKAEVDQLEKEADWLAGQLSKFSSNQWREAARNAVDKGTE